MKIMILFVAYVDSERYPYLEVSDGWYSVFCEIDAPILQLIKAGKLKLGQKIAVCGSQLLNAEVPTEPLEKSESLRLKISYNGCRPAHWNAKLGFFKSQASFFATLNSILPNGGLVPRIRVVIQRIYPVEITETLQNGNSITKSERQHRAEVNCKSALDTLKLENMADLGDNDFGLRNPQTKLRIVLKLRVSDCQESSKPSLLNVWNPSESLMDQIFEGSHFLVTSLRPNSFSGAHSSLVLSTTRSSQFVPINKSSVPSPNFVSREPLTCFDVEDLQSSFDEFDVIGITARISDGNASTVFVCDESSFVVVILFSSSLKLQALHNLIKIKSVLLFKNLRISKRLANSKVIHFEYSSISDVQLCSDEISLKYRENLPRIMSQAQKTIHQLLHGPRTRSADVGSKRKVSESEEKSLAWRMEKLKRYPSPPRNVTLDGSLVQTPVPKRARQEFKSPSSASNI